MVVRGASFAHRGLGRIDIWAEVCFTGSSHDLRRIVQFSPQTTRPIARLIVAGTTLASDAERRSKRRFRATLGSSPDARIAATLAPPIGPTFKGDVCPPALSGLEPFEICATIPRQASLHLW